MSSDKVLGIDIGGTKVAVCLADSTGKLLDSGRIPTGGVAPYEEILPQIIALCKELLRRNSLTPGNVPACGICAPGPLDMQNGLILKSPNLPWDHVPILADIQRALGIRCILENDANGGILAEYIFGTARGYTDAVYLTMSTGVGGGVISGGKLITGATGIGAELGHIVLDIHGPKCNCGLHGCLEAYTGGRGVANRLREALKDQPEHPIFFLPEVNGKPENLSFQVLREAAKAGIPLAVDMWDEVCMRLAQGIGIILSTFNPQIVILGTAAYYAGDFLLDPVKKYLPRFAWKEFMDPCKVCVTELGLRVGELAGAAVAFYSLRQKA